LADGSVGQLTIYADFRLNRPLLNGATMLWTTSVAAGGPPIGGQIQLNQGEADAGGSITNAPQASFTIRTTNSLGAILQRVGGNGVLLNFGLIQSWSDATVTFDVPYVPQTYAPIVPRLENKQGGLTANGSKVQVSCGVIENDAGAVLVLADGIDQSGNAELDNAGEVDVANGLAMSDTAVINNAATMTVLGGFNLSSGAVLSQGDTQTWASVTADTFTQSGGTVTSAAPWTVTGALTLSNGSFTQEMAPYGPSTLVADSWNQSGGQFVTSAAAVQVTHAYVFSGGTADYSGTQGGLSLAAAEIDQSGGTLTALNAHFEISGPINQTAGTVQFNISGANVGGGWTLGSAAVLFASHSGITGDMTNGGQLEVGLIGSQTPSSDHFDVTGNYTQTGSGRLTLDGNTSATEYLSVSGLATLGGTCTLRVPPGTSIPPMWAFGLMVYGTHVGTFSSVVLPPGNWMLDYGQYGFTVRKMY
jgi:hypothetical protein